MDSFFFHRLFMRYHYEKPSVYASVYGNTYEREHLVYDRCTLFKIDQNGLSVIVVMVYTQQLQYDRLCGL